MRLIVKFSEPRGIAEFMEVMEAEELRVENVKQLEYLVTSPVHISTERKTYLVSMISEHPCIASVAEAPRYTAFNANDFT